MQLSRLTLTDSTPRYPKESPLLHNESHQRYGLLSVGFHYRVLCSAAHRRYPCIPGDQLKEQVDVVNLKDLKHNCEPNKGIAIFVIVIIEVDNEPLRSDFGSHCI